MNRKRKKTKSTNVKAKNKIVIILLNTVFTSIEEERFKEFLRIKENSELERRVRE